MAPKTKKSSKTKAAKPEVIDEVEDDEELEELEEDEATDAKPSKGNDDVVFGASDLAKLLSEKTGKNISARDLRTLLRKMARDGRLDREITAGNRSRYSWSGPNDPEVKAIIKAVTSGELEQGKQEALAKLKEQKAAKQAAKAKEDAKKNKKAKKKATVVVEDEDDDEEDDEDE
jgi:MarR-like DNA-binding transcriptional regulator SgrR of sgrS sRNA